MSTRLTALAAALIASTALAACTGTEEQGRTEEQGHEAAQDAGNAAKPDLTPPIAGANVVTVTAREFTFDAPAEIPAGLTTFRLVEGGKELHHIQLVKLEGGKTISDFQAALKAGGPPPKWAVDAGGPNPARPGGGESNATMMLEPGNYAITCFIPSADGVPHIMKGMIRPLTVTPAGSRRAAEPEAHVVMKLVDYAFDTSRPLTPGQHTIRIDNAGKQPHEVAIVRLAPGKSVGDFLAWVEKLQGPPPGEPIGGVSAIAPGTHQFITVDLQPGEYALVCFVLDAKDGKPHFVHGMAKQIKIGSPTTT